MEQNLTERGTKEEKKRTGLPKNVRQIGNIQGSTRIYMEDYVYTYLHGAAENWNHRGCILLGNRYQENGQRYLFISGAVRLEEECFANGIPEFTDMLWGMVYQEMKQFYEDVEILGWGMDVAGASAKLTGDLERIHRNAFQGQDKLLFLMDSLEQEEAFYIYEKNVLRRRDGYYIYYEKNPQMREYMMQGLPAIEEDPQQGTVNSYRKINSRNAKRHRPFHVSFVQVASLVVLVGLSAIAVNAMSSTVKTRQLLEAVSYLKADETGDVVETNKNIAIDNVSEQSDQIIGQEDLAGNHDIDTQESIATGAASEEEGEADDNSKSDDTEAVDDEAAADEAVADEEEAPQKEDEEAELKIQETLAEPETDYYVVEPGESLLAISQKLYGRDCTKELCELNGLEDADKIYAGQKLFILKE
jgi:LysM repeat protein